jgi:FtsH-binding integral membrane protein
MDPDSSDIPLARQFLPGMGEFEMSNWSDPRPGAAPPRPAPIDTRPDLSDVRDVRDVSVDSGLRKHMLSVYNYMTSGILLTGVVSLLFALGGENSLAAQIFIGGGLLKWVVMLAPFGLVLWLSFGINKMSEATAQIVFWLYSALMGASLSYIFLIYTGGSIALTFFATAAAFSSLSLYGYTTKRDLSGMGTFLMMGLVGLIVAMLLTAIIPGENPTMTLTISGIGVLIFAGLTVYDTQKIKSLYFQLQGSQFLGKAAIMGALQLYLDFINMFLFLLRFLGSRD